MQLLQNLTEWALRFVHPEILELGTSSFRRLQGRFVDGRFIITRSKKVIAPRGLVLSSHLNQTIFDLEEFQTAIRDLFHPEQPAGRYVAVVLPDPAFHFATMAFPTVLFRANPLSLLEREIQNSAPLPLREYAIRYEVGQQAGNKSHVFCCVTPHGLIRDLEGALNSINLIPLSIQPSFLASMSFLRQHEDASSPYPSVFFHVGHESTTMAIFSSKGLKRLQTVPIGGLDMTQALGRSQGLMFEQAENLKRDELILLDDPTNEAQGEVPLFRVLEPLFTELLQKLYGFLQVYSSECPDEAAFRRIVLSGAATNMKNFDRLVSSNLGIMCIPSGQIIKTATTGTDLSLSEKTALFPLFSNLALQPWSFDRLDRVMAA